MDVTLDLAFTPPCPLPGKPSTESSFVRITARHTFAIADLAVALVDVWNFGWEDAPIGQTLGPEPSLERGRSHAQRKRRIVETRLDPRQPTYDSEPARMVA